MKNLNIDIILAFVFQQCVPYFQLSSYWYITINFVANGYSQKLILFVWICVLAKFVKFK